MTDDEYRELTSWRMSVDDRFSAQSLQMGTIERNVMDLQASVEESGEWSKKNHDSLLLVIELCQNMDNARKLADAAVRWGKPFAVAGGFVVAVVVWIKTGEWRL